MMEKQALYASDVMLKKRLILSIQMSLHSKGIPCPNVRFTQNDLE